MSELNITSHAGIRMRQRGFRQADIHLVLSVATPIGDDAYAVTEQDAAREIAQRKYEIQQLERLRGTRAIVKNGCLITIYHEQRAAKRFRQKAQEIRS